jgi:hypothetical protein
MQEGTTAVSSEIGNAYSIGASPGKAATHRAWQEAAVPGWMNGKKANKWRIASQSGGASCMARGSGSRLDERRSVFSLVWSTGRARP